MAFETVGPSSSRVQITVPEVPVGETVSPPPDARASVVPIEVPYAVVAPRSGGPPATSSAFSLTVESASLPHLPWFRLPPWARTPRWVQSLPIRWVLIAGATWSAAAFVVALVAASLLAPRPRAFAATLAAANPPLPPSPEPPPVEAVAPQPSGPFSHSAAWHALYVTSHQVAGCRRSKVWGGTTAIVTFASDGSVNNVAFRAPFTGSATASCVAGVLESAHVPPFAGKAGVVEFWFYVSQK